MATNVIVRKNGKTYGLTKEEFIRYMENLSKTAKARKAAREDMKITFKEEFANEGIRKNVKKGT